MALGTLIHTQKKSKMFLCDNDVEMFEVSNLCIHADCTEGYTQALKQANSGT